MSVEYQQWLIPSDNAFDPPAGRVVALIDSLLQGGWILNLDEKGRCAAYARESGPRLPTRRGSEWNVPLPQPM
jgi:hypothetical protein